MGKYPFVLETGGHCFLCLSAPVKLVKSEDGGQLQVEGEHHVTKVFSFERLCQYLKPDLKNVFDGAALVNSGIGINPVPVLEQSELQGTLCGQCAQQVEQFSEICVELEVIQRRMHSCLQSIYGLMVKKEEDERSCSLEDFKRTMLSRPETLVQYGIVERLWKNILEQCSKKMGEAPPKPVFEEKLAEPPTKRLRVESPEEAEVAEEADGSSSSIKITSVQGSCSMTTPFQSSSSSSSDPDMPQPSHYSSIKQDDSHAVILVEDDDASQDFVNESVEDNLVELECDICHVKVTDLSTHLYTDHFEQEADDAQVETQMRSERQNQTDQNPLGEEVEESPQMEQVGGVHIRILPPTADTSNQFNRTCSICQESFPTVLLLLSHHSTAHPKDGVRCHFCRGHFPDKVALNQHQQTVHFERPFECKFCFDWFTTEQGVSRHIKLSCPVVGQRATGGGGLPSSSTSTTSLGPTSLQKLSECEICHKQFLTHQGRSRHYNVEHEGHQMGCDLCHQTFLYRAAKYTHKKKCPGRPM